MASIVVKQILNIPCKINGVVVTITEADPFDMPSKRYTTTLALVKPGEIIGYNMGKHGSMGLLKTHGVSCIQIRAIRLEDGTTIKGACKVGKQLGFWHQEAYEFELV